MNDVEQKILLEQIITAYKNFYVGRNRRTLESIERDLEVFFARKVDGRTLVDIGDEFGVTRSTIMMVERSTARRISRVLNRLGLKGMF